MLVALREKGGYISLLDLRDKEELRQLRRNEIFLCPVCKVKLMLKIGDKKAVHFSHQKEMKCHVQTEAESVNHLQGKQQLFHWIINQYPQAQLEPYIGEILQRPDISFYVEKKLFVIEYQCSRISEELFRKRTLSYLKLNIEPLWIIDSSWIKQVSVHKFTLSPFLWQFATSHEALPIKLIFYSPEDQTFKILTSIIPYSESIIYGSVSNFHSSEISLTQLISSPITNYQFRNYKKDWLFQKINFRMHFSIHPPRKYNQLLNKLYSLYIPPGHIPAETGLPCTKMYWIQTNSVIWQLWILLDSIHLIKIGENITYKSVYSNFMKRVDEGHINLRVLPLVRSQSHVSHAIMEYLQTLQYLGILKRTSTTSFKKISQILIPNNHETASNLDLKVIEIIAKMIK
ncbi:competence protein CoiA [Litchfieldia alkalitelluris]|uniref:competence protein CoiA n=1 Tax=Litchfieldia alkalitelluris TaxID=304268 RepID=UPI00147640C3|nr:competence protein CoiA family protein [Litchfieldia alkalitelluris]